MPIYLHNEAANNLRYIRSAMQKAEQISTVSGLGGMLMGAVALVGAAIASLAVDLREQLWFWAATALPAIAVGAGFSITKALRYDHNLLNDPARRFLWCLTPNLAIGALLSAIVWRTDLVELIPGIWLLLYGAGVLAAGTYAVRPVLNMGASFVMLGTCVVLLPGLLPSPLPAQWANVCLALGFGGLHFTFGWQVYRHHGG
jgi:hypothetical protein